MLFGIVCGFLFFYCLFFSSLIYTKYIWGCSSDGRALHLQCRGQGFESPHLHFLQKEGSVSSKDDFNRILDSLFGIGGIPKDGSVQSFAEYLKRVAVLGEAARMQELVNRLSGLGLLDEDQVSIIMGKIQALSEDAKEILENYDNFDSEDMDGAESDDVECDCDFCVLSEGLETGEDVNSIRARLKKKHDAIKAQKRSEDASKSFYVVLLQEIVKSPKTKEMKGLAFGPFSKNVAGWKIHLVENRVAKHAKKNKGDMMSFIKRRKGSSSETDKWNFVCADSKERDRTSVLFKAFNKKKSSFGFMMVREDEFSGADILEGSMLKDWHLLVDSKIKSTWNVDKIAEVISGFVYDQNS